MPNGQMLLKWARATIQSSPFNQSPELDASLLLAQAWNCSRAQLYAQLDKRVPEAQIEIFHQLVRLRCHGHPLAYLVGEKAFYQHTFCVGEGVLVPRPESELLVEWALRKGDRKGARVLELCCGSACVAISLATQRPFWQIDACDISLSALRYAQENWRRLGGHVTFWQSDLFNQLPPQCYHLIVANPPYLTSDECEERQQIGWVEPRLALDGGPDGMTILRRIISETPNWLFQGGWLILEGTPSLMPPLEELMRQHGFTGTRIVPDLAGLARVILAQLPQLC